MAPPLTKLRDIQLQLTTHLSTPKGWKAESAWLVDLWRTVYPHKWSPVSYRSSAGQRKFTGQRPTFYHWATQPTVRTKWPMTVGCHHGERITSRWPFAHVLRQASTCSWNKDQLDVCRVACAWSNSTLKQSSSKQMFTWSSIYTPQFKSHAILSINCKLIHYNNNNNNQFTAIYSSTSISQHLQLKTEAFCRSKILQSISPCWQQLVISD